MGVATVLSIPGAKGRFPGKLRIFFLQISVPQLSKYPTIQDYYKGQDQRACIDGKNTPMKHGTLKITPFAYFFQTFYTLVQHNHSSREPSP